MGLALKTGDLTPQQKAFVDWLVNCPKRPKRMEQLAKLKELTGVEYSKSDLIYLRLSPGWRIYTQKTEEELYQRAKRKAVELMPQAMELYGDAMKWVKQKKDYRAAPPLVVPLLDRVIAKHEQNVVPLAVTITLTASQERLLELAAPVVEAEVVEIIEAAKTDE